ncbi:hypothetical protein EAH79_13815 [Sphingomonas koreensis]|nr:hypothetical protein EAH79_13815 [Sphingomonas koreensis]
MEDAMSKYGRADIIKARLGLNAIIGEKIAAVITFSAAIENFLERAIWRVNEIDPSGTRPETDSKQFTTLIEMLQKFTLSLEDSDLRTMLETWCRAARASATIRNNIAHGMPSCLGGTLVFMRNYRWGKTDVIDRKRAPGDLWAKADEVELISGALAVLLRIVGSLARDDVPLATIPNPEAMRALRAARSVLGEFADPGYNSSYEKY